MLQFGTPASQYSFLFDSGSTKTWIKDSNCRDCGGTYNTNASTTFLLTNDTESSVTYADGTSVSGPMAQDSVSLNGLRVEKYQFILARKLSPQNSSLAQYQGISGFGPTSTESKSFFSSIFDAHPTLAPVVSYFIDNSQTNGGLILGGIDTARFSGRLAVQEIVTSSKGGFDSFSLPLDSIKVGEYSVPLTSARSLLIDTGTSLTVLPLDIATEINERLNLVSLGEDFPGLFGTYCPDGIIPEGMPNITIIMGKVKLKITPDVYSFLITDRNTTYCISGIQGTTDGYSIIGNVFLRRYYTVFDLHHKRIGFATCNREPKVKSSIIAANLTQEVVGLADPNSVFGETSSESFGHMIYVNIYGIIILICMANF